MPRVVACGGRQQALDKFCVAHQGARADDFVALLVDSEGPVAGNDSWEHVGLHPPGVSGDQIHLMMQAMEAWFHADKTPLQVHD